MEKLTTLTAISPIDGRYREKVKEMSSYFSEEAIFKYRVLVEIEYLIALSHEAKVIRNLTPTEKNWLHSLVQKFNSKEAQRIKEIEKVTNHDVKAVEYHLKEKLSKSSLKDLGEMIHFGLTSDDINNLAYGLALKDILAKFCLPSLQNLREELKNFAFIYKDLPMLARTHGQVAIPTTLGKEIAVFVKRLTEEIEALTKIKIRGKLTGNIGNLNAHYATFPNVDWLAFSQKFVSSLSLDPELLTTQILPYDSYIRIFDCLKRINNILISLTQDFWIYIALGFFKQKIIKKEIGSSALPHKVNPIYFENAEGVLGLANSFLKFFSDKLLISRLQRDLSDSPVRRTFGETTALCLLGWQSLLEGLSRVEADKERLKEDLLSHWEVVSEGIQSILRAEGYPKPYEILKDLTRGKVLDRRTLEKFINSLPVSQRVKEKLKKVTPLTYLGIAEKLARLVAEEE